MASSASLAILTKRNRLLPTAILALNLFCAALPASHQPATREHHLMPQLGAVDRPRATAMVLDSYRRQPGGGRSYASVYRQALLRHLNQT